MSQLDLVRKKIEQKLVSSWTKSHIVFDNTEDKRTDEYISVEIDNYSVEKPELTGSVRRLDVDFTVRIYCFLKEGAGKALVWSDDIVSIFEDQVDDGIIVYNCNVFKIGDNGSASGSSENGGMHYQINCEFSCYTTRLT